MARRRRPQPRNTGPTFRKNNRIRVPEVRLIGADGEQVGVVSTDEARRMAQEAGLDLVEVSPTARPPVCKILDYGKFKYEQQKKEKKSKTHNKGSSQLKELRVRPAISDHDLSYRLTDGRKFLMAGHKVQVVCIFRGRQMAHPEHGHNVMKQVADQLADISRVEMQARLMGRRMTMLLSPLTAAQRARQGSGGGGSGGGSGSGGGEPRDDVPRPAPAPAPAPEASPAPSPAPSSPTPPADPS